MVRGGAVAQAWSHDHHSIFGSGRPECRPSGQTPPPAYQQARLPAAARPPCDRDQVRDLGRLRRTVTDRKVAGVAGGIARHLDIDPFIVRVAFVVLSLFGGAGLIVYAALLDPAARGRPAARRRSASTSAAAASR